MSAERALQASPTLAINGADGMLSTSCVWP